MKDYPSRLAHKIPGWIPDGAIFHIRIRCSSENRKPLTLPSFAPAILESVRTYVRIQRWHCLLFLLMPDHLHALLQFSSEDGLSGTIQGWKRYHRRMNGIVWQDNFFDHRIRTQSELADKFAYIEQNPVVCGLCGEAQDWPWKVTHGNCLTTGEAAKALHQSLADSARCRVGRLAAPPETESHP